MFGVLALAFRDNASRRLHPGVAFACLTAVAVVFLVAATLLSVGIDQKALAKNIADDIRAVPLKVEIAGSGASTAVDGRRRDLCFGSRNRIQILYGPHDASEVASCGPLLFRRGLVRVPLHETQPVSVTLHTSKPVRPLRPDFNP